MNDSLISVIIPAYNAERFIERSMKSIMGQTYENWELIVVDDGSTDRTYELATALSKQDHRIRVIHTENGGVCHARNLGIDEAHGEYLTFLDADDALESYALQSLLETAEKCNSDILIAVMVKIKETEPPPVIIRSRKTVQWVEKKTLIYALLDHPATYSSCGKLYRRSFIGDTRFDVGHKVHEDGFFIFELALKQPVFTLFDEYVYRCYITEGSASRAAFSDKFFDILYFANRKKEIIEAEFPELISYIPNLTIKANMALLSKLSQTYEGKYKSTEKQCINNIIKNKQFFKPATCIDKKLFWVVTHHLYGCYKFAKFIRSKMR